MREILFKGKDLKTGEWRIGYYSQITKGAHLNPVQNATQITKFKKIDNGEIILTEIYEVEPSTICQYTGLTDKNGVQIWEGDIVEREIFDETVIGNVVWRSMGSTGFLLKRKCPGGAVFYPVGCGQYDDDDGKSCNDIIVGNIFDSPELLEV